ncbi:hypothetical protein [Halogeometricum borinquense]|uniref:hypothetical protein n=1 Tax=Halogeometricum borinquense TaxID=60847 RepID=UPI0019550772|nr:hypothetical protein [Halogeometricum borinquense]
MGRDTSDGSIRGVVAYGLFLLGAVFIGPLEAVVALALYWLLDSPQESAQSS